MDAVLRPAGRSLLLSPLCAAVVWSLAAGGCARRPDKWEARRPPTYKVEGVVLWDGKPEPQCLVAFESKSHALIAVGITDAGGRFVLKTFKEGDGAVAGEHAVRLEKTVMIKEGDADANRPPVWLVVTPKKYADTATSGLTATVADEGKNDLTLEITGPRATH